MPGRRHNQSIASPRRARPGSLPCCRIGGAAKPALPAIVRNVRFIADQDHSVWIRIADRDAERSFSTLKGLTGGSGDVIRRHIVLFETRVHKVSRAPALAAIVAAVDSV